MCFPVDFEEILKTLFLQDGSGGMLQHLLYKKKEKIIEKTVIVGSRFVVDKFFLFMQG